MKYAAFILVILALFIWVAPQIIGGLSWLTGPPYVIIGFNTAIKGHITSHDANRRKYTFAIDNRKEVFDFDRFSNELIWPHNQLGTYLEDGDFISKEANSAVLQLSRKGQVSEWTLADTTGWPRQ